MTFPLVTRRRYLAAVARAEQKPVRCPGLDDSSIWAGETMTEREKWIYRVAWHYSAEANRPLTELEQRVGYQRDKTIDEMGWWCQPDARRTREGAE